MTSRYPAKKLRFFDSPMRIIFLSYIAMILFGAILLHLPFSQKEGETALSFLNCLFTATSAVCVAGLTVVPTTQQWSLFGQIIILVLVQVGGISIIALTSFIVAVTGRKIGFKNHLVLQNMLSQNNAGGLVKKVKRIIKITFIIEGIGAVLLALYFFLLRRVDPVRALYYGVFHSVSAFCNAGFDILGTNGLIDYSSDIVIHVIFMVLAMGGGIGIVVWEDVIQKLRNRKHRTSITSRLAVYTSAILLLGGGLYFFIFEYSNPQTIGGFSLPTKMLNAFYQSVSLHTAGMSQMNQYGLTDFSKFVSACLMIIGGSPGGMAGGIKTVTIAIIFHSMWSIIRGREGIEIMNRSISLTTLQKALAVAGIMVMLLGLTTFMLSISEQNIPFAHSFLDIMYECASALGTVGLTTGITPHLTTFGKLVIGVAMLVGRVGPITVIYAITKPKKETNITLPETEVLIG